MKNRPCPSQEHIWKVWGRYGATGGFDRVASEVCQKCEKVRWYKYPGVDLREKYEGKK